MRALDQVQHNQICHFYTKPNKLKMISTPFYRWPILYNNEWGYQSIPRNLIFVLSFPQIKHPYTRTLLFSISKIIISIINYAQRTYVTMISTSCSSKMQLKYLYIDPHLLDILLLFIYTPSESTTSIASAIFLYFFILGFSSIP